MKLGAFMMPSHPPERSIYDGYQWDLSQIELFDRLGFDEAWIGEHFTAPWEPNPAPDLLIAQALMRDGDRLLANELHPDDHAALADNFRHDRRVTVSARDGYQVLKALLPPKERRGIVVVDPPFEVSDEFERLAEGLAQAMRRFATGTYLVWYPLKDRAAAAGLLASIAATGVDKTLIAEFYVRAPEAALLFNGCGLLLINPPFTLSQRLDILMPFLTERLAQGPGARYRLAIS